MILLKFLQEVGEEAVVVHDETADALYGSESKEYLCLERIVADLVSSSFLVHSSC